MKNINTNKDKKEEAVRGPEQRKKIIQSQVEGEETRANLKEEAPKTHKDSGQHKSLRQEESKH